VVEGAVADSSFQGPQRDIGDVLGELLHKDKVRTEATLTPRPGLSIVALPSIGYNPAYGVYFGIGASAGGWLGDPKETRISVFALNGTYSTSKQLSIQFKSDAWVPGNRWNFKGDWRYLDTSQPTYGLGPVSEQVGGDYPMDFIMWRLYQTVYLRMGNNIFAGLGYHLNIHDAILDERAAAGESTPFTAYSGGAVTSTVASGLSANILIDSRDTPIYPTKGVLWNASVRGFSRELGGHANWQELWSDFRAYPRMGKNPMDVLAIWVTLWTTYGPAPYLDLPANGWDTFGKSARGYVQGRLRSQNQIYAELEYRKVLTKDGLLGATVFVNGTSSTLNSGTFSEFDPGGGIGLRVMFIKRTKTNLTVDYGWGKNSQGLWLGTQEYF
jgi:outer membrane protein assembly factor BamA